MAILRRHREAMPAEEHDVEAGAVFGAPRSGGHRRLSNACRNWWKPLVKSAGLPTVSLHAPRPTSATLLLLANANPKIVSERLGHASITLTLDTYSHVLPTMQETAALVIGRLLGLGPDQDPNGIQKSEA